VDAISRALVERASPYGFSSAVWAYIGNMGWIGPNRRPSIIWMFPGDSSCVTDTFSSTQSMTQDLEVHLSDAADFAKIVSDGAVQYLSCEHHRAGEHLQLLLRRRRRRLPPTRHRKEDIQ
jgi:hypothetical protein